MRYFYDCAAAFDEKGGRLENLVACALLKYCHFQHDRLGRPFHLFYFRDREKRKRMATWGIVAILFLRLGLFVGV